MGHYTKMLFKKNREKSKILPKDIVFEEDDREKDDCPEWLRSCAIERDGLLCCGGFKSHADIRRMLKDEDPYTSKRGDIEGFMTSENRFVTREEGKQIAMKV